MPRWFLAPLILDVDFNVWVAGKVATAIRDDGLAEREACAKLADEWSVGDGYVVRVDAVDLLADIAEAIRARGKAS